MTDENKETPPQTGSGGYRLDLPKQDAPLSYVTSGEFQTYVKSAAEIRAMQDKRVEGVETRQAAYEVKCEDDRKTLRTDVTSVHTALGAVQNEVKDVKEKMATKEEMLTQTSILKKLETIFTGWSATPRGSLVVAAFTQAAIAFFGFLTYWFATRSH